VEKISYAKCDQCPFVDQPLVPDRCVYKPGDRLDILFIGEAPGRTEVQQNKPFVGRSGDILNRVTDPLLHNHTWWITNAALCFDPNNGTSKGPVGKAAFCCRGRLDDLIERTDPKVIITLGNVPLQALVKCRDGISKQRGKLRKFGNALLMPTYHPAAILRNPSLFQDFVSDIRRAIQCIDTPEQTAPDSVPFTLTVDFNRVFAAAEAAPFAVLDLETTGLDYTRDHIICYVVATDKEVFIMPETVRTINGFTEALAACKAKWVGHNSKFDRNFMLYELGVPVHFSFDTMLAHYLLDERGGVHDLKGICASLYGAPHWEDEIDAQLKLRKTHNYDDIPKDILYKYAALDGYWTVRLTHTMNRLLALYPKLLNVMLNVLMPASEAFSNAETQGVLFDTEANQMLVPVYMAKLAELQGELERIAGVKFNPRSSQQTANVLYNLCGVPPVEGAEGSTDAKKVLIKRAGYPIVDTLLQYRAVNTLLTRYIEGLSEVVGADGRIHTSFQLHGTMTGRLSSSPNLQNLPRSAQDIKSTFIASPGHTFIYADYSQLELRCIAWLSDDEFLLNCYRNGIDLHSAMAETLFGKNYTKDQRSLAKRLNFGMVYGRSVTAIANDGLVPMSRAEAARIQRLFFERMPRVQQWIYEVRDLVQAQQWVESPLGRRRRFPIIPSDRLGQEEVYRQAVNMIPQSMAADLTTVSFVKLDKLGFHPLLSVHDSILCEVDDECAEEALHEMIRIMETTGTELYGDKVPFVAEGSMGKSWGDIK